MARVIEYIKGMASTFRMLDFGFVTAIPMVVLIINLISVLTGLRVLSFTELGLFSNILLPYIVVMLIASTRESRSPSLAKLSLIKSLPVDKKRIGQNIIVALLLSTILSILIIVARYSMAEQDLSSLTFLLLAIKLPMIISALFLMLPTSIFRGLISQRYICQKRRNTAVVWAYFLAIGGTVLTQLAFHWPLHNIFWVIVSVFLYAIATYVIKNTYDSIVSFLEGPLENKYLYYKTPFSSI